MYCLIRIHFGSSQFGSRFTKACLQNYRLNPTQIMQRGLSQQHRGQLFASSAPTRVVLVRLGCVGGPSGRIIIWTCLFGRCGRADRYRGWGSRDQSPFVLGVCAAPLFKHFHDEFAKRGASVFRYFCLASSAAALSMQVLLTRGQG